MVDVCNIDGELLPEPEATVPVLDRGFLFGDSVYEVIRTRGGKPFAWREHLDRLAASADGISLPLELDDTALVQRIRDTMAASGPGERYIRIMVSRGTGTAPNIDLEFAPGPSRTVILVREISVPAAIARIAVVPRLRIDRRALDPSIKSGNYLNNVLGLAEARSKGATDCVFLNADGCATEASTSNLFVVVDGVVTTPPLAAGLLAGITRALVFECAGTDGIPLEERDCPRADLLSADEVFLTSTLRDISAVSHVDGRKLGDGSGGPVTLRLQEAFSGFCAAKAQEDGAAFDAV